VLCLHARVAEEIVVGYHGHKFFGGHGGPAGFANVGVVDQEGWGDDTAEAGPVLSFMLEGLLLFCGLETGRMGGK
jgi:hypothetical protein